MTMMTMRLLPLAAAGLLLAACQTMTPEERRAADANTCASYGFRRGTDAFATCLQRIELDRRAERRSLRYSNDLMLWGWNRPVVVERRVIVTQNR
ncbi:hypothetical protein PYH37_003157 [Sinorhizobium numidicum]|uniref:Lipoprotein n=1 Tax=Sinorhizobium numidicum TaxID=680248 RepID=A0ABY8D5N2_9HYPH|nr:hypothetical protein [Sinorhizobium numidicum]WEX79122.1 hypothetical protein PYH37_003157 [Sinorhizobium numidicum]WEX85148.1 hypothetical protein PYH38_003870 [Sinorhizobium numidicum]